MDDLALLRCLIEWGADEALDARPRDRLTRPAALPVSAPAPPVVFAASPGPVAQAQAVAAAAHNTAALRDALAGFDACPLQATALHLVFADGNPDAGLMVIGDAPGEDEDRSGRAFSGPGGRLLDRMLASIGLDRRSVLLTYAIPWRPPGNRKPTEHERALCLPFLHRHIALLRPRRLLVLGTPPAASLSGASSASLRRMRGRWQSVEIPGLEAPVAALYGFSPDHLLAAPDAKQAAWADLLTLRIALDEDRAGQP